MTELTPSKAGRIIIALKGVDQTYNHVNPTDWHQNVFVNAYGEILILCNQFNYKTIGKIINENRFQIGRLQFDF